MLCIYEQVTSGVSLCAKRQASYNNRRDVRCGSLAVDNRQLESNTTQTDWQTDIQNDKHTSGDRHIDWL